MLNKKMSSFLGYPGRGETYKEPKFQFLFRVGVEGGGGASPPPDSFSQGYISGDSIDIPPST